MRTIEYGSPDLLRRHEVADRLQISTATLDLWAKAGKIPVVKHPLGSGRGRKVFYHWPTVAKRLKIPG